MQKQQRDEVFSSISAEETAIYRDLIREVWAQRKASSTGQFTAREMLGPRMECLQSGVRDALNAVIARDEMGPMPGEETPGFELKLIGSLERLRLSSFKGSRPVGLIFGSYT